MTTTLAFNDNNLTVAANDDKRISQKKIQQMQSANEFNKKHLSGDYYCETYYSEFSEAKLSYRY